MNDANTDDDPARQPEGPPLKVCLNGVAWTLRRTPMMMMRKDETTGEPQQLRFLADPNDRTIVVSDVSTRDELMARTAIAVNYANLAAFADECGIAFNATRIDIGDDRWGVYVVGADLLDDDAYHIDFEARRLYLPDAMQPTLRFQTVLTVLLQQAVAYGRRHPAR